MLYHSSIGRIKDSYTFYDNGCYYLFSMFSDTEGKPEYHQVWMARSLDGVHWKDVGAVIKAPFPVWAMSVVRLGDSYWLNHGSFAEDGTQSVIRFWSSENLVDWHYHPDMDLHPDTRFFPVDSRLDCMDISCQEEHGKTVYYGFATGPSGFMESADGKHWQSLGPVLFDWNGFLPPLSTVKGDLEVGGCRKIGEYWYYLAGCFNLAGGCGYATVILRAENPRGPFKLDVPKYRLYGSNGRWVSFWSRFCETDHEMLISNSYIYSGYSYESGETWIPPLKRAALDTDKHLYLAYWKGNDCLKGAGQRVVPSVQLVSSPSSVFVGYVNYDGVKLSEPVLVFSPAEGVVLEGTFLVDSGNWCDAAPECGFYLEETEQTGAAIIISSAGVTRVGALCQAEGRIHFAEEMIVSETCASSAGAEADKEHFFRLLVRKGMFELYVDDRHSLTFNTAHTPGNSAEMNGKIRLLANGGGVRFMNLKAWMMNLEKTDI